MAPLGTRRHTPQYPQFQRKGYLRHPSLLWGHNPGGANPEQEPPTPLPHFVPALGSGAWFCPHQVWRLREVGAGLEPHRTLPAPPSPNSHQCHLCLAFQVALGGQGVLEVPLSETEKRRYAAVSSPVSRGAGPTGQPRVGPTRLSPLPGSGVVLGPGSGGPPDPSLPRRPPQSLRPAGSVAFIFRPGGAGHCPTGASGNKGDIMPL